MLQRRPLCEEFGNSGHFPGKRSGCGQPRRAGERFPVARYRHRAVLQEASAKPALGAAYNFPAWNIVCNRLLTMPIRTSALRTLGAFANVFAIESFVNRLVCMNGMVVAKVLNARHIGKRLDESLSDEAIKADDRAFWLAARDILRAAHEVRPLPILDQLTHRIDGLSSDNEVSLRTGDELATITFLRSEIESLAQSGLSLMPEGLERDLTPQDLADLIKFLKGWRYQE